MVQVTRPSRATATTPGRPSSYCDAVATEILERLACGESLRSICGDNSMPDRATVARWIANDTALRARYDVARQLQEDAWRDEIHDLARSEPLRDPKTGRVDAEAMRHVQNQVGTLQWLLMKLRRKANFASSIECENSTLSDQSRVVRGVARVGSSDVDAEGEALGLMRRRSCATPVSHAGGVSEPSA